MSTSTANSNGRSADTDGHWNKFLGARTVGTAFANTAAMLYERDLKQDVPLRPKHVVPFVVNASFAIELYLKALAYKHGLHIHGHDLLQLFKKLPSGAGLDIQDASATVAVRSDPPQFQDVQVALTGLRTAFVDWRYSHEKSELGPVNLGSVVLLLKVMHEACSEALAPNHSIEATA